MSTPEGQSDEHALHARHRSSDSITSGAVSEPTSEPLIAS